MNMLKICNWLEIIRWALVIFGFQLAYFVTANPITRFNLLAPIIIIALCGLTGIESVFFGRVAINQSGYPRSDRYQIQSGLNNLALALAAILAWWCGWGFWANLALMSGTLIFFGLSGINHGLSAITEHNYQWKNLFRPLMSLILIIAVLMAMLPALASAQ